MLIKFSVIYHSGGSIIKEIKLGSPEGMLHADDLVLLQSTIGFKSETRSLRVLESNVVRAYAKKISSEKSRVFREEGYFEVTAMGLEPTTT